MLGPPAVRRLLKSGRLTMAAECAWDANADIRRLVGAET